MKRAILACLATAGILLTSGAVRAGIIEDLSNATIVEDFRFDDASGTDIPSAANSAGTGHLFDADADSAAVVTNGLGQLDVSLKNNVDFGSHYVDNDNITSGRVLGVMELTWDFDTSVFDPAQDEELRITLINNDPRGTQVTAELEIQRNGLTALEISGSAVGGDAIGPAALSVSQTMKFIAVVDANLDTDIYYIHYSSDGGASFTSLGPGAIDAVRIANSMRLVLNEDFVGDNVLIDRVYLATIPEPASAALAALAVLGLFAVRRREV